MDHTMKAVDQPKRFGPGLVMVAAALLLLTGTATVWAADAGPITEANLAQRIADAKTPAEHEAIATYFRAQAASAADSIKEHEAMLKSYEKVSGRPKTHMDEHCKHLLQSYRQQEKAFQELAADHEKMAKAAEAAQH